MLVKRSVWLNPMVIFCAPWIAVYSLFFADWTKLFIYPATTALPIFLLITLPFLACYILLKTVFGIYGMHISSSSFFLEIDNINRVVRHLKFFVVLWGGASIFEIIISGGLPLISLLRGSGVGYKDFGIHSLHGFLNSLLLACSLVSMLLYVQTKKKRFIVFCVMTMVWGGLVVSRALILSNIIQLTLVYLLLTGLTTRRMLHILIGAFVVVTLFGVLGELRSGSLTKLVTPTKNYPDFLPIGFLWLYIYLVTPINNLLNSIEHVQPLFHFGFPNTTNLLFPSVLRYELFDQDTLGKGDLVNEAFNVSSAFIGPYLDFGYIGIALFSLLYGALGYFFWIRRDVLGILYYVVLAHCLIVSVFFNWLFFLPVIFQFVWLPLLLKKIRFGSVTF